MKTVLRKILVGSMVLMGMLLAACDNDDDEIIDAGPNPLDVYYVDSAMIARCQASPNYGKRVGVLGGSYTLREACDTVKATWHDYLGMETETYGVNGSGFCTTPSLKDQADYCGKKDIYVLWASTNDFANSLPVGNPSAYTKAGGYDERDLATQSGGINYCIKKLREKNPSCKIYMISSMQYFRTRGGYDGTTTNDAGLLYTDYIAVQQACCERAGVKFLNLYDLKIFTLQNHGYFYEGDELHLNAYGYTVISAPILSFLSDN